MPIRVLPEAVVSRIAAGEVVERPASVVKEMVENAIDAGATEIKVECLEGGRRMIRITDNGHGIRADEVELAFAHHATSKLQNADDLDAINTLGFRGEALASIASVSTLTCVTRHEAETSGTLIRIDDGRVLQHERTGRPPGTTMSVEYLFGRIPARLKFLKSNQTERGRIDEIVTRYAMAYPHVRFTLTQDGRTVLHSTGNGQLRDVLIEVFGSDDVEKMQPVDDAGDASAMRVSGYIGMPQLSHANRGKITLFVNGRPVSDVRLTSAVVQAYHTLMMVGRYPVAVVMVRVPPGDVDVNAHPAKTEVRFRDANAVFSAVQRAVRKTLLGHLPVPEAPSAVFVDAGARDLGLGAGGSGLGAGDLTRATTADANSYRPPAIGHQPSATNLPPPVASHQQSSLAGSDTWERVGIQRSSQASPAIGFQPHMMPQQPATRSNLPALRILGQLAETYIIAEGPEGLYLIDQHAAHERILFERMLAQAEMGAVSSQALLDPLPAQIPPGSAHLLEDQLPMLHDLGFEIETFGGNTFLIRAVPAMLIQDDVVAALREIVADLEADATPMRKELEARVLRRVCKRMAIKAGRVLPLAEMQALVRDLEACESPRTCPHGRPTMIQISTGALEKQFGRLG